MAEKRQRYSFVWDQFDLDEDAKKVAFKTCKATLAYNGTTSSMIKHIQAKHPYKMSTNEAAAVELVTTLINVMYLILKELNQEITVALRYNPMFISSNFKIKYNLNPIAMQSKEDKA
jgi:hypothetical protein